MLTKQRKIILNGQEIAYSLKSYRTSRRLRLMIYGNGEISVTKPTFVNEKAVVDFLQSRAAWITGKINNTKFVPGNPVTEDTLANYKRHKDRAEAMINDRLVYFNRFYGFKYQAVRIRRQKTRWGSCSKNGNLSFNYRILFLTPAEADYIIVHELCHLKEFNHSPNFWALVAQTIPDYRALRGKLKVV